MRVDYLGLKKSDHAFDSVFESAILRQDKIAISTRSVIAKRSHARECRSCMSPVGDVLRRYQNSAATRLLLRCFVDLECRANLFSTERHRERTIRIKQRRRRSRIFNI